VGIQIPNPKPTMVKIGDILNSGDFQEAMKKSDTGLAL
jgi:DNA segregation ATPase FtsK/SpoIIIE-like protein